MTTHFVLMVGNLSLDLLCLPTYLNLHYFCSTTVRIKQFSSGHNQIIVAGRHIVKWHVMFFIRKEGKNLLGNNVTITIVLP